MGAPPFSDDELQSVAEAATGARVASGDWSVEPIFKPVVAGTAGIWRVTIGSTSLVLKVLRHSADGHPNWLTGDAPGHWYYWEREALAYESGLLASFAGNARGARLVASVHRDDGTIALWLEDLGTTSAATWDLARFGDAARDLGHAQGAFAADRPLPDDPWLSRGWLRHYLTQRDGDTELVDDRDLWASQELRELFPAPPVAALQALRADQEQFLNMLDALPGTVCHLDLHPKNLFAVGTDTVLVDWAFVGIGALGEDPGNLVPDTVLDFHQPPAVLDRLHAVVLDGYLAGLDDAGWRGDPDLVRMGVAAVVAAKYSWIVPAMLRAVHAGRDTLNGRPRAEALARWAPVGEYILRAGDDARTLARRLL